METLPTPSLCTLSPAAARPSLPRVFLLYLVLALALAFRALSWPMVYDDLDLIKSFSTEEILGSFHGNWDPDGISNEGFRPLSLLFNHLRYLAFGENVVAHRLFLVVLYALYLTFLLPLAEAVGTSRCAAVVGGLFCLCSRYSVYHYVWITDGNHMIQGLSFEASLFFLYRAVATGRWAFVPASLGCLLVGLLVREDTAAVVPVIVLLSLVIARRHGRRGIQIILSAGVLFGCLLAALYAYRQWVVPRAWPPGHRYFALLLNLRRAFELPGNERGDPWTSLLVDAWVCVLVALPLALLLGRASVRRPLLWFAMTVPSCAASLTLGRADLLFFPATFAGLCLGSALDALSAAGPAYRRFARAAAVLGVFGGAYVSILFQANFHPFSSTAMKWNGQFLRGGVSSRARIPEERRRAIAKQLHAVGLRTRHDIETRLPVLADEAEAEGRRDPGPDGVLFVPRLQELW